MTVAMKININAVRDSKLFINPSSRLGNVLVKLLDNSVSKVSAFHFDTYTQKDVPQSDCRMNNALIKSQ